MNRIGRILQLSDLHLFGDIATKLIGVNPYNTMQLVLQAALRDAKDNPPNLVLFTGDISQDYSLASYKIAQTVTVQFSCPVMLTLGNHDYPQIFKQIFGDFHKANFFTLANWQIVVLNSHWPDHVAGRLTSHELNFLEQSLLAAPNTPTLIFIHHHVLPVASTWLDKINVKNAQKFLAIVDNYSCVKAVVSGHVHQETVAYRNQIAFFTTPSTCWQFAVQSPQFKLDTLMPGYRWIDLYEDGSFKTEVVRMPYNKELLPDMESQGY